MISQRKKYIFITLIVSINLFACSSADESINKSLSTTFFDLKGFFQKEEARLAQVRQIEKTVTINDEIEQQVIENPKWEEAFQIFTDSDINKSAWLDKYRADTSYQNNNTISEISYHALDEDLKTRELSIAFKDQQAFKVYILNEVTNPLLSTRQELTYERDKGYHIKSWQKQMLANERNLKIDVVFQ